MAALLTYGVLSSPVPASPGWVEAVIGGLLALAAGPVRALGIVCGAPLRRSADEFGFAAATLLLAGLFWLPLVRGIALGWAPEDQFRDLVPLIYLFLPVFLLAPAGPAAGPAPPGGTAAGTRNRGE